MAIFYHFLIESSVKCPDFLCHPGLQFNYGCGPCHPHPHKKAGTGAEEHSPDDSTTAATDDTKQPQADDSQGNSGNAGWPWPGTGFCGPFTGHPFAVGFRPCGVRPGPFGVGPGLFGQGAARFGPRGRWCGPRAWPGNNPWGPRGWGGPGWWGGCEDNKPPTAASTAKNTEDHFEDHHEDSDVAKEQKNEQ